MRKKAVAHLTVNKEKMLSLGVVLGLTGEALEMFKHGLSEVEVVFEFDDETGFIVGMVSASYAGFDLHRTA